jgi:hypothetical protein
MKRAIFKINLSRAIFFCLAVVSTVGCGSNNEKMTPSEIDAFSHPKAVTGAKGPSAADYAKMNEEIAAYNQKHKNDKVEFNMPGK